MSPVAMTARAALIRSGPKQPLVRQWSAMSPQLSAKMATPSLSKGTATAPMSSTAMAFCAVAGLCGATAFSVSVPSQAQATA